MTHKYQQSRRETLIANGKDATGEARVLGGKIGPMVATERRKIFRENHSALINNNEEIWPTELPPKPALEPVYLSLFKIELSW